MTAHFLLTWILVLLAIGGMATGLLLGRGPLRRGCAKLRADGARDGGCGGCARTQEEREEQVRWRQ